MQLIKITRDASGQHQMKRVIALVGFMVVSAVFIKDAWLGKVVPTEYVMYAIAATTFYAPQLALHIIRAWKGDGDKDNNRGDKVIGG